ncbi:hypothetical protein V8C26DRAFT_85723 [Trichoderma gracile]
MAVKVIVRASFFIISISIFIASVLAWQRATLLLLSLPSFPSLCLSFSSSLSLLFPPWTRIQSCHRALLQRLHQALPLVSYEPNPVDVSQSFCFFFPSSHCSKRYSTDAHRHAWPRLISTKKLGRSFARSLDRLLLFLSPCTTRTVWATVSAYRKPRQLLPATTDGRSSSHAPIQPTETYILLPYRGRKSPQASTRFLMYHYYN